MKKLSCKVVLLGMAVVLATSFGGMKDVQAKDVYACTSHGVETYVMDETIKFGPGNAVSCRTKKVVNGKLQNQPYYKFYTKNGGWVYDEIYADMIKCKAHPVAENEIARKVLDICNFNR